MAAAVGPAWVEWPSSISVGLTRWAIDGGGGGANCSWLSLSFFYSSFLFFYLILILASARCKVADGQRARDPKSSTSIGRLLANERPCAGKSSDFQLQIQSRQIKWIWRGVLFFSLQITGSLE